MSSNQAQGMSCILQVVERRLEQVYQLWKEASECYFDPDKFLLKAQLAIQTLRQVTFMLQSTKGQIPGFETWYEGPDGWQAKLKADDLMRWLVDARNKIEKQGDLETHSFVKAKVIASYLDSDSMSAEVRADLSQGIPDILARIPKDVLENHVFKHGALRVERRWVENTLPDREILDAIAYGYGRLAEVVADAHRHMGISLLPECAGLAGTPVETGQWLKPEMIGHIEDRSLTVSLEDGSVLEVGRHKLAFDQELFEKTIAELGIDPNETVEALQKFGSENIDQRAMGQFEAARKVFSSFGYHQAIAFLHHGTDLVGVSQLDFEDQQQKYLLLRDLANQVKASGADSVFFVNEVWTASKESVGEFEFAIDSAERQECLAMHVVSKDGRPKTFIAEIVRDEHGVSLGETQTVEGGVANMFVPIYQAWGKEIPAEWQDTV